MAPLESVTTRIRHAMWNVVYEKACEQAYVFDVVKKTRIYVQMPIDDIKPHFYPNVSELKDYFLDTGLPWYISYDLFERILFRFRFPENPPNTSPASRVAISQQRRKLQGLCNTELARAGSPYRFINFELAAITSDEQMAEIEAATNVPEKFSGAREQIQSALTSLAKKPDPDIRNCIEESLHAIESAIKIASGVGQGAIRNALHQFTKQHGIHPALEGAISKLYGFGSDKQGLRHPLLEKGSDLSQPDARMMLVISSALVNWIIAKDAGLTT